MRVECSKCGNLDDTSAHTVVLPEFLCFECECTRATEDKSVPESEDNSADEMLADMQIQLEQANKNIKVLEATIETLENDIRIYHNLLRLSIREEGLSCDRRLRTRRE